MEWVPYLHGGPKSSLANAINIAEFAVDYIRDIKWQLGAFSHLQIPQMKKEAIQALAKAHMGRFPTTSFDDYAVGKGLGFNILL